MTYDTPDIMYLEVNLQLNSLVWGSLTLPIVPLQIDFFPWHWKFRKCVFYSSLNFERSNLTWMVKAMPVTVTSGY